jgi:hypothetical protein
VVPAVLAQDVSEAAVSVFAPFVSRIRLSTRDPEVRLSWQDSEDVSGSYSVYRHTSPITADTFRLATLVAEVEPGVQSFIDAPDTPGNYYYAVIAKSAAGETYEVFIPYRNTTSNAVTVANTATVVEQAARVREIAAFEETGSILVEFEADQVGRDLIIYRSTKPFVAGSDLLAAGVVATLPSTLKSTVDYPVPGVPYYYGVVDAALVEDGSVTFVPGENATTEPVEIPLVTAAAPDPVPETTVEREPEPADDPAVEQPVETAQASTTVSADPPASASASTADQPFSPTVVSRRPLPLPFLQLNTDLETGRRIGDANIVVPDPQPVSSNTRGAIETLLAGLTGAPTSAAEPVILPDDTLTDPRGAEYTLRTILDGPFKGLAWEDALLQLNNFLTLPLSDEIRSRAVFYRAQCYYFTGDTQRAFVEFLLARGRYFTEVEEWLDTILSSTGA